jgi:hypothetical protein
MGLAVRRVLTCARCGSEGYDRGERSSDADTTVERAVAVTVPSNGFGGRR